MRHHESIIIRGAQENNLKNIDINIPKNKFVVITGVSGSGKSSLAFDTVYAEGYRRYVENLSGSARFFLQSIKKPKVKKIENLSPSIAIDQKSGSQNPRSTIGTITDTYEYLRYLYAQTGTPHCPSCQQPLSRQSMHEMIEKIRKFEDGTHIVVLARWQGEQVSLSDRLSAIENLGYARVRFDKRIMTIYEAQQEYKNQVRSEKKRLDVLKTDVVIDRMLLSKKQFDRERVVDSLQTATRIGKGQAAILVDGADEYEFNKYFTCKTCGFVIKKISPKHFSFNAPEGACERCSGLGTIAQIDVEKVIPNKKLAIAEGAIMPWSRSASKLNGEHIYMQIIEAVARKHGLSIKTPVCKFSQKKLDILLYGDGEEVEVKERGQKKKVVFEGIVKMLEEKYAKAESSFVRNEIEKSMTIKVCPECQGNRLQPQYLGVKVFGRSINELVQMEIGTLLKYLLKAKELLGEKPKQGETCRDTVARVLLQEIITRLKPLVDIGLNYLSLDRSCQTLSGGEFQRTRLATQLYSGLGGVIYVLDEPSIGLHSRDNEKLLETLKRIKNKGNSVLVVEHDREVMLSADYLIDMGPGAGDEGGKVIFEGTLEQLKQGMTETAQYLSEKKKIFPRQDNTLAKQFLVVHGACEHNLKNVTVKIPLKKLVSVVGVSGSGKSSLINDILAKALRKEIMGSLEDPGKYEKIEGVEKVSKVVIVDQSPIGRSPRSNAATYTGVFSHIRDLFAATQVAKERGYSASHFSFNIRGGRCEYCQGEGTRKIEMHLLDDVYAVCSHCHGLRYSKKVLEVQYHGVNIAQVLDMNIEYARHFFGFHKVICEKLQAMCQVGLGYLKLGQSATELSGGEAQRIKLATELARKTKGNTLYILDEPTIGLHFGDIAKLMKVLQGLVDKGNSVIVVEHNLDVIAASDWIIELGPEGGDAGGTVEFEGNFSQLKKAKTWTARAYKK
jgi:excinuclease ABC subunit A